MWTAMRRLQSKKSLGKSNPLPRKQSPNLVRAMGSLWNLTQQTRKLHNSHTIRSCSRRIVGSLLVFHRLLWPSDWRFAVPLQYISFSASKRIAWDALQWPFIPNISYGYWVNVYAELISNSCQFRKFLFRCRFLYLSSLVSGRVSIVRDVSMNAKAPTFHPSFCFYPRAFGALSCSPSNTRPINFHPVPWFLSRKSIKSIHSQTTPNLNSCYPKAGLFS